MFSMSRRIARGGVGGSKGEMERIQNKAVMTAMGMRVACILMINQDGGKAVQPKGKQTILGRATTMMLTEKRMAVAVLGEGIMPAERRSLLDRTVAQRVMMRPSLCEQSGMSSPEESFVLLHTTCDTAQGRALRMCQIPVGSCDTGRQL
jgi:hypothetical protein